MSKDVERGRQKDCGICAAFMSKLAEASGFITEPKEMKHMKRFKAVGLMCFCMALAALMFPSSVKPDDWNQKTKVRFNQPVEVPGVRAQVLPAGTYVFKVLDSLSNRHIVQIFNEAEDHVFTTILAIPNYRLRSTDQTVMTFRERAAGEPQAIRAWFFPGRQWGHEFVYPKFRAVELARAVNEPVLATPVELTPETPIETLKTVPVVAVSPAGEEVPVEEVVQAPPAEPVLVAKRVGELPQTASFLPLLGVLGLLSLGTGLVIWRFSKRTA
jgi:LPXTG-motif cell wall-anchored protein